MHPHPRAGCPGREHGVAGAGGAERAKQAAEHAGIGGQARSEHERAGTEQCEPDDPFHARHGPGPAAMSSAWIGRIV